MIGRDGSPLQPVEKVAAAVPSGGCLPKSPDSGRGFFLSVILSLSKDQPPDNVSLEQDALMISSLLIDRIKVRFPTQPFSQGTSPEPIISFPAASNEVGNLNVYDDGDEARVEIAKITHGHFSCYDESLSQSEREVDIAESVVDFIEQAFSGKIIFFLRNDGRVGGWQTLKTDGTRHEKKPDMKYYIWSGPLAD